MMLQKQKMNVMSWITSGLFVLIFAVVVNIRPANSEELPEITVYKSPTCGCCKKWVSHLNDNGFNVKVINQRTFFLILWAKAYLEFFHPF